MFKAGDIFSAYFSLIYSHLHIDFCLEFWKAVLDIIINEIILGISHQLLMSEVRFNLRKVDGK